MSPQLLELRQVALSYPQSEWRLGPVDLAVGAGEFLGIIGPNGSGKSTLLRLMAGVLPATGGTVRLHDRPFAALDRRQIARELAYLPQHVFSDFEFSVEDVVAMGRFPYHDGLGFLDQHDHQVVAACMAETDVTAFRGRRLGTLSGGELQRVFLASVLAQEPALLLLDEPTSALDFHHQVAFFSLLAQQAHKGMAVVVVTHDLNLAALFCQRVLLLRGGQPLRLGPVGEVFTPAVLGQAYGDGLLVVPHPADPSRPVVLPLPFSAPAPARPT